MAFHHQEGDSLVLALGQDVDLTFLERVDQLEIVDGVVKVNAQMMTGHPGVFAGGDMVPAERTVTVAVGPGKRFQFNYDYRKGCGMCAAECPCGAIQVVAETI